MGIFRKLSKIFRPKITNTRKENRLILSESVKKPKDRIVVGLVDIYKNGELIESTHNLVVYDGREYLASKSFNIGQYKDWSITHFAIGSGGTDINNPTTKIGPQDTDTDIYQPLTLNKSGENYLNNGILKPIDFNKVTILNDINTNNHLTIVQLEITIVANDEPDLQLPARINEIGLYYTNSDGQYRLFAHTVFLDKYLEENDSLTIIWKLFF